MAVGWYLNQADPFYIIGIDASDFYENHIDNLKKYLYSDFFKRVKFHFIDISDSEDALKDEVLAEYLLKQGLVLDKKQKHVAE